MHLGHSGKCCPNRARDAEDDLYGVGGDDEDAIDNDEGSGSEDEWEDDDAVDQGIWDHEGSQTFDRIVTIIDVTGIHQIPVAFCRCRGASTAAMQMLGMMLYPTSYRRPATAFTFAVLQDFILANRVCKTPASSYFSLLRRRTNPQFPHKEKVPL